LTRIDHFAIVVPDLSKARNILSKGFGMRLKEKKNYPELGMKVAILEAENIAIELIEPTGPGPYWKSRKKKSTLNHFAIDSRTIPSLQNRLKKTRMKMDKESRRKIEGGYIQNVDPSTVMGL